MTHSEVQKKIESISYPENRYVHCGALNICDVILKSNNFSAEIKLEVKMLKLELKEYSEPWVGWERTSLDYNMLRDIQDCLNSIYELME
ncbi:hypothetical protein [Flavobacterium sp. 5]|uniref:hypothetical protein n=1 Tax=Flavobacterium sp. 5 TaxID=2035199 RepID=UPI000C2CCDD6|nr:hypothetical protein [Flavobacterium sp. 5]PKB18320.1 hypothetical protein CLU82_3591 [Flavobacterium sp. 5]